MYKFSSPANYVSQNVLKLHLNAILRLVLYKLYHGLSSESILECFDAIVYEIFEWKITLDRFSLCIIHPTGANGRQILAPGGLDFDDFLAQLVAL